MPVYVIVVKRGADAVEGLLAQVPRESVYQLSDSAWLVDFEGTTKECAERFGIRGDDNPATGIAFPVSNYSGKFPTDVWEWLGLHLKRETN